MVIGLVMVLVMWLLAVPVMAQEGGGIPEPVQPIQVGVVIQGADGLPQTYCVTLSGENPTGLDAIQATGLDILTSSGPQGTLVCRVDQTGCTPPGENCFCQCEGGGNRAPIGRISTWANKATGSTASRARPTRR